MADESVMAQARSTWLKEECAEIGADLSEASFLQWDKLYDAIFNMSVQWSQRRKKPPEENVEAVKSALNTMAGYVTEMQMNHRISVENAEAIRNDIAAIQKITPPPNWPGTTEVTGYLYDMRERIRNNMFEQVVECQCGRKP